MYKSLRAFFAKFISSSGPTPAAQGRVGSPFSLPASLDFEYVDAKGVETCRWIEVTSMKPTRSANFVIWGYCEQRQAMRCFRLDRMKNVSDANTGETATVPLLDWLLAYSPDPKSLKRLLKAKALSVQ